MHAHHEFAEHLRELLAGVGAVRLRPMFGGLGVYLDDCMFGLVMDETLYLKTDPASVDAFRDAGGEPFVYRPVRDGHVPGYWTPPGRGTGVGGGDAAVGAAGAGGRATTARPKTLIPSRRTFAHITPASPLPR